MTAAESKLAKAITDVFPKLDQAYACVQQAATNVKWWNEAFFTGPELKHQASTASNDLTNVKGIGSTFAAYITSGQAADDVQAGNPGRFNQLKADWSRSAQSFLKDMSSLQSQLVDQTIAGRIAGYIKVAAKAIADSIATLVVDSLNAAGSAALSGLNTAAKKLEFGGLLALVALGWLAFSSHPVAAGARHAGARAAGAVL